VKANRLVLLAVAGTSMLAFAGCAPSGNVAARVGSSTVPTSDVDFLTRMQCITLDKEAASGTAQGAQMVPTTQVRIGMANTLVQSELNRQLAERKHLSYDRSTLTGAMAQFAPVLKSVPAKDRDRFRTMVEDIYRGQLQVYTLAQSKLADQGVANPSQDQITKAVNDLQSQYRKSIDVEVNPQYGAGTSGQAGSTDPSLSRPVSSFAKQAGSAQPDARWVAKLPDGQRCG